MFFSKNKNKQDAASAESDGQSSTKEQTFVSHLVEMRDRLLKAIACVFVVLLCLFPFSNFLYGLIAEPLLVHLSGSSTMIATQVASPFLAPFKLTAFVAVVISVPYIFFQAWSFIAPGLYMKERRLALPLIVSSTILFYLGIAFAYYAVFPLVFGFFTSVAPEGVTIMTDISHYLDFVLKIFLAFGAAFEVPVATYLIVRSGLSTVESLGKKRPYIIVGSFVLGMVLTPPDVISQTMLALPIWVLYEIGLLMCKWTIPVEGSDDEQ
ncbi:MAG: twin-arginine translocase subunit TatC [Gammaproteobacteria bacterium]|jgi:sec-independent protein translocase protein TatC|nr:twin-arginine translocase subunit TatC [Pseudomonadota bacterium]MDG2302295.1 twin-arginine translocase subunit TatC [Gammaproteobacteria bacterium]MBT5065796.1 twin-arginine translocase subunit TatC [Pseudomonadota bacterium]MBT6192797.1 twin-arginine translocase subunit TatC [Pseudomonadota bacterium]MBT6465019.1 twin-arginine translocase subunit TatC [Pseudomonadota bacterium]